MEERFIHRTLAAEPTPEEAALSNAIVRILSQSIHDLSGIVKGLNESPLEAPGGGAWDEASFRAAIGRLGAFPNSVGGPLGSHASGVMPVGNPSAARPSDNKGV